MSEAEKLLKQAVEAISRVKDSDLQEPYAQRVRRDADSAIEIAKAQALIDISKNIAFLCGLVQGYSERTLDKLGLIAEVVEGK